MASWKKMAEAFGRALADPSTSREGRRLIKAGKRELTDARLKPTGNGLRIEPSNPRYDKDVADAYTRGEIGGIQDDMENIQKGYDREERSKLFDERTEQRTDEALNKEWDDAFNQSSAKFKDQSASLTDEDADVWRSELLRTIDILRKRGFSDGDILKTIKGE